MPTDTVTPIDMQDLKQQVGICAAMRISQGQCVGLGTGSTAAHLIKHLARRIREENLRITAVSTSWSTTLLCRELGIPLLPLESVSYLDIAIDGADEIDSDRNLIKGRGAAHTLEKIVAAMAGEYIIIADHSKRVGHLGTSFPVPVEILAPALGFVSKKLQELGGQVNLRMGSPAKDGPAISDSGNLILDAHFGLIKNPAQLEKHIANLPGVVGNGLFCGLVSSVLLATESGIAEF